MIITTIVTIMWKATITETFSMLPLLVCDPDVPARARARMLEALRTTSPALRTAWLEEAAWALVRDAALDRDDAFALLGLDDHQPATASQRPASIVCQAATSSGS